MTLPIRLNPAVVLILGLAVLSCSPSEPPEPPATPPLSRSVLGYGVVTASYTKLLKEPSLDGVALGFVRERTILRVLENRLVKNGDLTEYWLLVEGEYQGWLPLGVIDLYDNEGKAKTAAGILPAGEL
jgi:hypothetical protein